MASIANEQYVTVAYTVSPYMFWPISCTTVIFIYLNCAGKLWFMKNEKDSIDDSTIVEHDKSKNILFSST
jgi:hypothetical protein